MALGRRKNMDMTVGSVPKNILLFAFPLLLGNLFQQLYNMVDTWVIGQTGQTGAYAAVGSIGPVINILIGFFLGLSSGAGVVISQYFGAKKEHEVRRAVHTAVAMTLIMGVLFTALGLWLAPYILRLMLNGEQSVEVYPFAKTYLTIYFAGVMGLMVYNIGAGILRAVGDSRRPFYFLVVSAVLNTVLDLVFVFGFEMGVAGVALATVIAQAVSAVLTVITLLRTSLCVQVRVRDIRIDREMLGKIVKVGIPAALQMAITAFSNVFVQSYIANVNGDQTACLGGWTTYSKVDMFIFMPVQSIALAVTTFVGQNLGCGQVKRAKKGTFTAFLMALGATVAVIALVMALAAPLARIFNPDPLVVHYATLLLHTLTPFYVLCCVNQIFSAALRGAGDTRAPMIIMLSSFVAFRQVYLFVMSNYISNEILPLGMSYPAGWLLCAILTVVYYLRCDFSRNCVVEE